MRALNSFQRIKNIVSSGYSSPTRPLPLTSRFISSFAEQKKNAFECAVYMGFSMSYQK